MKYIDTRVTFEEFPDEISLCINISNCPNRCPGCHSQYLWNDVGDELTILSLTNLINKNRGITCVGFMGGDIDPESINEFAKLIKNNYKNLKVGWYSGMQNISPKINTRWFDYIKVGPYIERFGPLNKTDTNQIMYKVLDRGNKLENITQWFWRERI